MAEQRAPIEQVINIIGQYDAIASTKDSQKKQGEQKVRYEESPRAERGLQYIELPHDEQ